MIFLCFHDGNSTTVVFLFRPNTLDGNFRESVKIARNGIEQLTVSQVTLFLIHE